MKTDEVKHSGRTLYQHLVGTYLLLRDWGCSDDICKAGLFHSIYGTQRFTHQSWPFSKRIEIVQMIGPGAERLVYLFCVCDRPRALIEAITSGWVHDQQTDQRIYLNWNEILSLLHVEAANLIEQGGNSHWLKRIAEVPEMGTTREHIRKFLAERDQRRKKDRQVMIALTVGGEVDLKLMVNGVDVTVDDE